MFGSGVLVSLIAATTSLLVSFERLSGPLPFAAGVAGGAIAIPVVVAQGIVMRFGGRAARVFAAALVPWLVALPCAAALVAASSRAVDGLAASVTGGDGCDTAPSARQLAGGRWSLRSDERGHRLSVRLPAGEVVSWVLGGEASAVRGDGRIRARCAASPGEGF